jgi:hypothetical protein
MKNSDAPYGKPIPALGKPPSASMHRPRTRVEQEWCWFYYVDLITNHPQGARFVLDNLEKLPTFKANWEGAKPKYTGFGAKYGNFSRRQPKHL